MTFFEWGSFEVSLFLISYLGPSAIASQTIMMSAGYYLYMLPSAVATAAMTRVGNFLGAGDALGARRAAIVSGVASLVTGGFAGILLTVFGEYWPFVYTNDLKIAHVVIQVRLHQHSYVSIVDRKVSLSALCFLFCVAEYSTFS